MDEINLESSIVGFCSLHGDIVFVKNQGVLIRNDDDFRRHPDRVMLISGGGAGHEPGFGGFVGRGMLSAAVSGNIFTSPSVTRFGIPFDASTTAPQVTFVTFFLLQLFDGDFARW